MAYASRTIRKAMGTVRSISGAGAVVALALLRNHPAADAAGPAGFWSFKPAAPEQPPAVSRPGWIREPVDAFVLAGLERAGLAPSREAAPRTLVRRVHFALTGLPPTVGESEAFAADPSPDAYERLVDRLLASPAFGERLASLWLPIARYAEDQAHQVGNDTKHFYPNAWRYRDWVIRAFNDDVPYDRFIRLQLAADHFAPDDPENQVALGFLGLGPKFYNRGRLDVKAEEWADHVDTVSRAFLGLTVACARCHDHKFDPISMEDYYGLAGVFASMELVNETWGDPANWTDADREARRHEMHVVRTSKPTDLPVYLRGNVENPGPTVPRRFLSVIDGAEPRPLEAAGGRADLAEAIADPGNPLTARVFVNRVWGLVFGTPIVDTPSNFGTTGSPPSHPELLDDLAVRFVRDGWSTKRLVRELVRSATFRQASSERDDARAVDPANRLLWRMSPRRLSIEQWRDSLLAVAGALDGAHGRSLELDDPENRRRTVHARVSRLELNGMLMQFDYPDANVHHADRSETTTPVQKLFTLNSPFVLRQAEALLRRIEAETSTDSERVGLLHQMLFARPANDADRAAAAAFLGEEPRPDDWTLYAQALLISNEMWYVD